VLGTQVGKDQSSPHPLGVDPRALILFVLRPALERCECIITRSTARLPIPPVHCLKMKMGAVKLLRSVLMQLPERQLSMAPPEFRYH